MSNSRMRRLSGSKSWVWMPVWMTVMRVPAQRIPTPIRQGLRVRCPAEDTVTITTWGWPVGELVEGTAAGLGVVALGGDAAADALVGAVPVVAVAEGVELGLELGEGAGGVEGGEVFLEGLVEAFELPAGLGVVGAGGDLVDSQSADPGLEDDFETQLVAGEDQAVIGDQSGRRAVLVAGGFEDCRGVLAGHGAIERDEG